MADAVPRIAIVDYGMGNLFSVQHACEHAGLDAHITPDPEQLLRSDGVILPGVGAFGDAMDTLDSTGLSEALREAARVGTPLFGICLGLQLLMSESTEFGLHAGLGLIPGRVVPFARPSEGGRVLKVPQLGWNRVWRPESADWSGTPLDGTADGEYMYFVHSYHVIPASDDVVLATTRYGDVEFCSAASFGNVFACQFHPERSGPAGIRVYERIARIVAAHESTDGTGKSHR